MTLPGVDFTVAQALLSALGEVDRFPDGNRAAAYLGLVPSTYQSGEHCYHGHITKQGRSHARWLLVQAAQHLDRHPGPLGVFFRRIARKKNRNVAVVATARKLVTHRLADAETQRTLPLRAAANAYRPSSTGCALRATGKRRKTGIAEGLAASGRLRLRPAHPRGAGAGFRLRRRAIAAAGAAQRGRDQHARAARE